MGSCCCLSHLGSDRNTGTQALGFTEMFSFLSLQTQSLFSSASLCPRVAVFTCWLPVALQLIRFTTVRGNEGTPTFVPQEV